MNSRALLLSIVGVPLAALSAASCKKKVDADAMELSETFRAPTGSAIVSFPTSMVPKIEKSGVIGIEPKKESAFDPHDSVIVTDHPSLRPEIATLDAYVTFLHGPHAREMKKWAVTSQSASTCLGQYSGVETNATYDEDDGASMRYWSCTFVANNHGFKVAYATPEAAAATDAAALRKIADSVRVTP